MGYPFGDFLLSLWRDVDCGTWRAPLVDKHVAFTLPANNNNDNKALKSQPVPLGSIRSKGVKNIIEIMV